MGLKEKWIQHLNKMPCNRLSTLIKTTPQKAEGTKEDHRKDFWMCETGNGQQVAQLFDSYIMMMIMMNCIILG
jgi:hypothetical protein